MKRENWPVEDYGIRPAGPQDRCLYCKQLKGAVHSPDCVIRQRTVVVRAIVEYVIAEPEYSTPEQIEFHRNEGSWCSSNGLDEIARIREKATIDPCEFVRYEFVREATEQDEVNFMTHVIDLPS